MGRSWESAALMALLGAIGCGGGDEGSSASGAGGNGGGAGSTGQAGGPGSGGTGGDAGTGGGAGGPSFQGTTRVHPGGAEDRSADLAIAPDGTIYVSWVVAGDVHLARSVDGGESFAAPILLDDAGIEPIVGMARHPRIAASDARVAVAFNDEGGTVYLYTSAAPELTFGAPTLIGTDVASTFRDFPKPVILGASEAAVAFHAYPASGARVYLARESTGFTSEDASGGAPGVPCECCPVELMQAAGGDVLLAFRNNDANDRDMWLARAPQAGAFSSWIEASSIEGQVPMCPMQGPRLVELGASEHAIVWSSRGDSATGAAAISFSPDDGVSWGAGAPIGSLVGDEPTVALGASGRIYVTAVTGNQRSSIVTSDDGGATWSDPAPLTTPDGDLSTPQALGQSGLAALAGVSESGAVWLARME
jgi:hypothetical protein